MSRWRDEIFVRHALATAFFVGLASQSLMASAQQSSDAPIVDRMSSEAREAAGVVDAFHQALSRNDPKAALALMAENAMVFEGGHVERSKAEYAGHHAGADAMYASTVPSRLVRRSGSASADTAWVMSETRATGRYKDKAVDRVSTETMVLRKSAEGWRIVHIHWSSRAAT